MTSSQPGLDSLIEQGAEALRAGERGRARELLAAAVRADPGSAQAWLWLAGALDDPARQRECLERALRIDPASVAARRGLGEIAGEAGGRGRGGRWGGGGGGGGGGQSKRRFYLQRATCLLPASRASARQYVDSPRRLPRRC